MKLACVNWYGFQLEDLVINGLDRQPLEKITSRIVELGFNCVRLVYSLDVFYKNSVSDKNAIIDEILIGRFVKDLMFLITAQ